MCYDVRLFTHVQVWTRLCATHLMSCDVTMLDEPSGLRKTLGGLRTGSNPSRVSIICTSHATAFLANLRTHIIDFQDRRLKASKGAKGHTLTMFAKKYLVKKA